MDIPHFTEAQKRRQDELFAEAAKRKELFSSLDDRDLEFENNSGSRYFRQAGTDSVSVSNRRSISIRKPNMEDKPKIPQHNCKVDYYETTDAEGRVWQVEHRH